MGAIERKRSANLKRKLPANLKIRHDFRPGDIGYLTYLHGTLYAQEHGWDCRFEAFVTVPLARFASDRCEREQIWIVERDEQVAGSIAILQATPVDAQLRWFLLHPELRGCGLGRLLLEEAIRFCRDSGYQSVFLWTVSALTAAVNLYRTCGFCLQEECQQERWGAAIAEQKYALTL